MPVTEASINDLESIAANPEQILAGVARTGGRTGSSNLSGQWARPWSRRELTRIPYKAATRDHPIHQYFTQRAREYASTMQYRAAQSMGSKSPGASFTSKNNNYAHAFMSMQLGVWSTDWLMPMAAADYGGAGVSYPFTPLGYLLFHDRQDRAANLFSGADYLNAWRKLCQQGRPADLDLGELAYDLANQAIVTGTASGLQFGSQLYWEIEGFKRNDKDRQVTTPDLAAGGIFGGSSMLYEAWRANRMFCDPAGWEVACIVLGRGPDEGTLGEMAQWQQIQRESDDFQDRWVRGEWWSGREPESAVRTNLKKLLKA